MKTVYRVTFRNNLQSRIFLTEEEAAEFAVSMEELYLVDASITREFMEVNFNG